MLPMLRLLAGELPTLAEHAEAYAELAAEEAAIAAQRWKLRMVALGVSVAAAALAVGFGGVALILWGALPEPSVAPARWLLWAVPGAFAAVAVAAALIGRGLPRAPAFAELRSQWREDMAMLRAKAAP